MYGCNNTCLKFKKNCFAKFSDSVKITSQSIKMALQFDDEADVVNTELYESLFSRYQLGLLINKK